MKSLHTKGGLWPPQESCYLEGVQGCRPASSEASCRPHSGWCIHKATIQMFFVVYRC